MTLKQKVLIVWLVAVLVIVFAAHHFLGSTVCLFQNMVACEIVCVSGAAKLAAIFVGPHCY